MKEKIIFISDLHLGSGKVNDFHHTYHLHKFFDYVEKNASELVICGDFLELLQSEFTEIYIQHHPLFRHLFSLALRIPTTLLIGNHDALLAIEYKSQKDSPFFGSAIKVLPTYENSKLKIHASHGNEYSLLNAKEDLLDLSEGSSSGDRITRIVGWLEENINPNMDSILEKIYVDYKILLRNLLGKTKKYAQIVNPSHPKYAKLGGDFSEYERGAKDVLASPKFEVCVFGHTHLPSLKKFKDGIYANCGSWVKNNPFDKPPTFVEVNKKEVKLIDAETYEVLEELKRN